MTVAKECMWTIGRLILIGALLVFVVSLGACTVLPLEPLPVVAKSDPKNPAYVKELEKFRAEVQQREHRAEPRVPDVDVTMKTHMDCRYLFAPGSDGMTNCLMRGMDRHVAKPVDERYLRPGDVTITVPRGVVPRHDPGVPAYPVAPGAAAINPSALADCRVDRSGAPCYQYLEPQPPWGNPYQPGANR